MRARYFAMASLLAMAAPSHAQGEKTWLYLAAESGGLAWNLTDLTFDNAQDMYQGTMIYYSPIATPIDGHRVYWVLEDFDMRCAQASYISVSAILYDQDMAVVGTLFEPTTADMDANSVYNLLHHILCDGGAVNDVPILEAKTAAEAMQAMARKPPQ